MWPHVSSPLSISQWLAIHIRLKFKLHNLVLYDLMPACLPTCLANIILVTLPQFSHVKLLWASWESVCSYSSTSKLLGPLPEMPFYLCTQHCHRTAPRTLFAEWRQEGFTKVSHTAPPTPLGPPWPSPDVLNPITNDILILVCLYCSSWSHLLFLGTNPKIKNWNLASRFLILPSCTFAVTFPTPYPFFYKMCWETCLIIAFG